jgi:hypothetical protein
LRAFLDFEASSLSKRSYPIEVAWVLQDGQAESHLIAPAPPWDDWDMAAEAVHRISRAVLEQEGKPHQQVAHRMVEALSRHELFASAPSWDGKWLSVLLRSAGLPRHALRLRDTDEALRETATEILKEGFEGAQLDEKVKIVIAEVSGSQNGPPAHRALGDARTEYKKWCRTKDVARKLVAGG